MNATLRLLRWFGIATFLYLLSIDTWSSLTPTAAVPDSATPATRSSGGTPGELSRIGKWPSNGPLSGCTRVFLAASRAYVLREYDFHVIDLSDPTAPREQGRTRLGGNTSAGDVVASGQYAYVSFGTGLDIVDVGDPQHPAVVVRLRDRVAQNLCLANGLLYAANGAHPMTGEPGAGCLSVWDIADPSLLQATGSYCTGNLSTDVAFQEPYLYIVANYPPTLQIVSPGEQTRGAPDDWHPAFGIDVDQDYAYLATGENGLDIVDISIPTNPHVAANVDTPGFALQVAVVGDFALIADNTSRLETIDVSQPQAPFRLPGFIADGTVTSLSSRPGTVCVTDSEHGLIILSLAGETRRRQRITFETPPALQSISVKLQLSANASSGLPMTFSLIRGPATVTGDLLTVTGEGTIYLRADQAGDDTWRPVSAERRIDVARNQQVIDWQWPLADLVEIGETYTLAATASSGLPVRYAVISGPAAVVHDMLTPTGLGTVWLRAEQAGTDAWAAVSVDRRITIIPGVLGRLTFAVNPDGTASITGGCSAGDVIIPKSIHGRYVTGIGDGAFEGCRDLATITISDGIISLGDRAFMDCPSLTRASLPHTLSSIGRSAFRNCGRLGTVTLVNGLERIEREAFYACFRLTHVTIPATVTSIGGGAFSWNLAEIAVDPRNPAYTSVDGILFDKDQTLLIASPILKTGHYTIPPSVTRIGDSAFAGCFDLAGITIPDSVTSIGYEGFFNCGSLTDVRIPAGVTVIEERTFLGCVNLTNVTIPWSVTRIGSQAFGTTKLPSITIPQGVTDIGEGAFAFCDNLRSIVLGESVRSIGQNAFSGCTNVETLTLHNSEISIGDQAFADCVHLKNVAIGDGVLSVGPTTLRGRPGITNLMVGNSITELRQEAFEECPNLEVVFLGSGLSHIDCRTFSPCRQLMTIGVNDSNPSFSSVGGVLFDRSQSSLVRFPPGRYDVYQIPDSVKTLGCGAFQDCGRLTGVIIPGSVTSIGSRVFSGCSNLGHIAIPESITSIGESAFSGSRGLLNVTIPESVTSIDDWTFWGCTSLTSVTSVTIGKGVTRIGNGAFSDCTGLTNVTVPDSVTSIGNWAFSGCTNLTGITIGNDVTRIGDLAFWGCVSLQSITIPESVTRIGDGVFWNCASLTSITIPDRVTSIGDSAFSGCAGLSSITIPDRVTSIGDYAFSDCSLEDVLFSKSRTLLVRYPPTRTGDYTIPDSVTAIASTAFEGCTGLTSVTITDSITSVGFGAFEGCTGLTSVTIPKSVTSIGKRAFGGCASLEAVYFAGDASPSAQADIFTYWDGTVSPTSVHYLPGTTGWNSTFSDRPTAPWVLPHPTILDFGPRFGPSPTGFSFVISWATHEPVVVEASAGLSGQAWTAISTNTLTDGWVQFTDPGWQSHPARFYRVLSENAADSRFRHAASRQ